MLTIDEKELVEQLQQGEKKAFSTIFSFYYKDLVLFARSFIKDEDFAEEIVQEVFVKLWEHRHFIHIAISLKSYLLKSIQNKCLDWIKHQQVKENYRKEVPYLAILYENNTDNYILYSELQNSLNKALETLPPDIAEAFRLSRFKGLKYGEIAVKLDVSVRTVEVRIGKALQLLKEALKDHLGVLLLLIIFK